MLPAESSDRLNDLLIKIGRSLLQYVRESWPWTSAGNSEARRTLERVAEAQIQDVAALVECLTARDHVIDFGTYPTEYTSLHYVSLDYLLSHVIADQEQVVHLCETVLTEQAAELEVVDLLRDLAARERQCLDTLRGLARRPVPAAS